MAIKRGDEYYCFFCDYHNKDYYKVDHHMFNSHDFVLVPLEVEQLSRLVQFIYTRNPELITEKIVNILKSYLKPANQIIRPKKEELDI